jgi:hypothetical protein
MIGSRFTAKELNECTRPCSAASQRGRDLGQLRGERLLLAILVSTLPALDAKLHGHSRALLTVPAL